MFFWNNQKNIGLKYLDNLCCPSPKGSLVINHFGSWKECQPKMVVCNGKVSDWKFGNGKCGDWKCGKPKASNQKMWQLKVSNWKCGDWNLVAENMWWPNSLVIIPMVIKNLVIKFLWWSKIWQLNLVVTRFLWQSKFWWPNS